MTIIYFVRHAHSVYTPDEYKRPISQSGRQEALKLVSIFENIDIQAMYASSYLRAVQTIEPIARLKKLKITQIEALNVFISWWGIKYYGTNACSSCIKRATAKT